MRQRGRLLLGLPAPASSPSSSPCFPYSLSLPSEMSYHVLRCSGHAIGTTLIPRYSWSVLWPWEMTGAPEMLPSSMDEPPQADFRLSLALLSCHQLRGINKAKVPTRGLLKTYFLFSEGWAWSDSNSWKQGFQGVDVCTHQLLIFNHAIAFINSW